jgi:hypothetical protein
VAAGGPGGDWAVTDSIECRIRSVEPIQPAFMSVSQFDSVAEIEAFRAGFQPAKVSSIHNIRLTPIHPSPTAARPAIHASKEPEIRAEMERRCAAYLQKPRGPATVPGRHRGGRGAPRRPVAAR